ncbi:MAG: glycosyltransferase [Raoultibacter sp.]
MSIFSARSENAIKVSVIVPVYNTATYLRQCLDSLLAQTLTELEIICVNDGSTDDSLLILEEYRARDSRIKIISKENAGYGHTMNVGFAAARGEYVGILESDDFADRAMYKDLYRFAKRHDLDVVKANYYEYSEQGDVKQEPFARFTYKRVFNPAEEQQVLTVLPIIWSALYRRQLISDNDIRFNESPGASYQDTSFVFQVWVSAQRAALLPKAYLHYRVDNAASSVRSSSKVFAVCDEYATSEAFLRRDADRYDTFAPILNLMKLGTYWWNYNRIADEFRPQFVDKMSAEYRAAREAGTLKREHFNDTDWASLELLMDDPEQFKVTFASGL